MPLDATCDVATRGARLSFLSWHVSRTTRCIAPPAALDCIHIHRHTYVEDVTNASYVSRVLKSMKGIKSIVTSQKSHFYL